MSESSLTDRVVRGSSLAAVGFVVTQAITFAAYVVLARLVTPQEFGVFAAGLAVLSLAYIGGEGAMISALVQREDRIEEAANTALVATLIAGAGFSLAMVAVAPLIGDLIGDDQVASVVAAMSGMLFLRAVWTVPDALLQRRFSYVRRVVLEPCAALAFGVVAIVCAAATDLGVWALVIGQYAAIAIEVVAAWGFARWRPRPRLASFAVWRELASFGRHVMAAAVFAAAGEQAVRLVVGGLLGARALGQYSYAQRIASIPYTAVLSAASWVLFPAFARIQGERERFRAGIINALDWSAVITIPAGMMLLPLGTAAAVLLFGEPWRPAGQMAAALSGFAVASALGSVALESVKASGRTELIWRAIGLLWGLTVISVALTYQSGLTAIGVGISIASILGLIYALRVTERATGTSALAMARRFVAPAIAAAVMVAVLFGLNELLDPVAKGTILGLGLLLGEALVGVAVYLVTLELVRPTTFGRLRSMVHGAVSRRGLDPEVVSHV